ncbi:MAG: type II/IV secretion system protein [Epsilonproteobacteria bacterium]|nr:type II/IV secretion system protein [Campylobacterota bacterium]
MKALIKELIKNGLIDKDKFLEFASKNRDKLYLGALVENNLIKKDDLYEYLSIKLRKGELSFQEIEDLKNEDIEVVELLQYFAKKYNLEYIDLDKKEIDASLLSKISTYVLLKNEALVIEEDDLSVLVVMSDPFNMAAQDAIARYFPNKILKVGISLSSLIKEKLLQIETYDSLRKYVAEIKEDLKRTENIEEKNDSPAVLKLIDLILKSSIVGRASDIHIEVTEKNTIVRDRVDGMLQQKFIFDKEVFGPLASRIKLLSNLDIAEKRKPQDGRFSATIAGKEYDFRVSTLPTLIGESIVLRILDKSKTLITLEDMGMNEINYNKFKKAINTPYGIVLVTGPTGSGKTTTLYASLNAIKSVKDKIITVEDPVEYQMSGIQQVQVNNAAGLTFAAALRAILRQDPDKIMIGEIRDTETLRIAVQAAMTGHLVLSTLHTNDAISAVFRMVDMGIESYLVSGSLIAIQAQRLVRKICPYCKTQTQISGSVFQEIKDFLPADKKPIFYKGAGCRHCNNSGYAGREMISEVLSVSNEISRMIANEATQEQIQEQANKEGFVSMFQDGILKALEGRTTIDEIFRVARL